MADYGPGRHTEASVGLRTREEIEREKGMKRRLIEKRTAHTILIQEYEAQHERCNFHCHVCGSENYEDEERTQIGEPGIFLCVCGEVVEHGLHFVNKDKKFDEIGHPCSIWEIRLSGEEVREVIEGMKKEAR